MSRILAAGLLLACGAVAQERVALVVGNSAYSDVAPLKNPVNDATDLAAELSKLGFVVDKLINADHRSMERGIDRFIQRLSSNSAALFHYSGHGMQVNNENYLIPVDFRMTDEASVKFDAVSASKVHERMLGAGARLSMMVLDACRNNGFALSRASGGGLAMMTAGKGSFLAFSTAPGRTAGDNPEGRNGLFTTYFLEGLRTPGLSLDRLFAQVRERTFEASSEEQLPWTSSSVIGDFVFHLPSGGDRQLAHGSAQPVQLAQAAPPPAVQSAPAVRQSAPISQERANKLEERFTKMVSRAEAVRASLEQLRADQARQGSTLRRDMQSAQIRMDLALDQAAGMLDRSDLDAAETKMRAAERDLETLEKFLGM